MNIWQKLIELEDKESVIQDFNKKYKNTILKLEVKDTNPEKTNILYLEYKKYQENYLNFINEIGLHFNFSFDENFIINIEVPEIEKGWFEYKNYPFICIKTSTRQWLRGVSEATYKTQSFYDICLINPLLTSPKQALYAALKSTNLTESQINYQKIRTNGYQIINKKWLITKNHYNQLKHFSLFYYQYFIGFLNENYDINLVNPIFKQELLDSILWKQNKLNLL